MRFAKFLFAAAAVALALLSAILTFVGRSGI